MILDLTSLRLKWLGKQKLNIKKGNKKNVELWADKRNDKPSSSDRAHDECQPAEKKTKKLTCTKTWDLILSYRIKWLCRMAWYLEAVILLLLVHEFPERPCANIEADLFTFDNRNSLYCQLHEQLLCDRSSSEHSS